MRMKYKFLSVSILAMTVANAAGAQTSTSGDEGSGQLLSSGEFPDTIVVQATRATQETDSVLGVGISVLDTPRSVTQIDATQLRDLSINSVRDLAKVAPSAYTTTQFGGANVPSLRGQSAELFQNGILRTPRSNGLPVSFNSVEGLEVVKGPAGVVYGPTGRVGGYVNFVTKKPYLDGTHGSVTATYGRWDDKRLQLDAGGPVNDMLAVRFSYERIDSDSYYRFGFMDSHDLYGAIRFQPSSELTIDANIEYYTAKFTENTGINRPTQELIDDGLYYQGTGVSRFGTAADPRNFRSVITVTGVTKIDRSFQLVGPTDYAEGSNLIAQLHLKWDLAENLTLANHFAFEDYKQAQIEYSQRYYNRIARSDNFQDRIELIATLGKHKIIGGVAYRYIDVLAFSDFFNEYLNATDITTDPARFPINNLFGVLPVPGRPNEFATPGAAYGSPLFPNAQQGTQDQNSSQWGFFLQGIFKITDKLSFLAAARADRIHEKLTDPLPPPGFTAARDTITVWEKAFNGSLTYEASDALTVYGTVNYNESPVTTNGGGFAAFSPGRIILRQNFKIDNYLYEGGIKASSANKMFYGTLAGFHQQRSIADVLGNVSKVLVTGGEAELGYQPSRNFSITASYSYLDARLPDSTQSAFTRDVYDAFAAPFGNGSGSPNFAALPRGKYRMPGLPKHLFNAFVKYKSDSGIGASSVLVATSPINTSFLGNVKIPSQYQLDASVFYEKERWGLYIDLYNITDENNWSAAGGSQGNDLINADEPFRYRVSVRYRF